MNFNKNISLLLPLMIAFSATSAQALEVVYPKSANTQVSAASTFFVGNVEKGSYLKINDKEVKVFDNGSFVEVIKLNDGDNAIKLESQKDNSTETLIYNVKKVAPSPTLTQEQPLEEFPENEYIYVSTVNDNIPLRTAPDSNAKRLTHLNSGTMLLINGKKGDYYRVFLTPEENAWIKTDSTVQYSALNEKVLANATNVSLSDDKLYNYIKTDLSAQIPYKVVETENGLTMELYNIKSNAADTMLFKTSGTVKSLAINTVKQDFSSTYYIELNSKLWGYNAYYEDNKLVLKIRKAPQINTTKPLSGITIAVDAGHGGKDAGAIGPTGVKEKEINLDISQKLKASLEQAGANVVMTRTDDSDVDLYNRPKTAQEADALILISLHANALADGADPYVKHGTSAYYYNNESKDLAETIKQQMITDLQTKDDGTCCCSFVLTRPTMPLSVLVEVAYMIHPDEYTLLLDDSFRQKAAESIKKALEVYLLK